MRLIVNADDYGYNPNCTRAITECLCRGWITNTTLMVNMPTCEQAVAEARKSGVLERIGLHVNIYGGEPLTDNIRACSSFCGSDGKFNHAFSIGAVRCWTPLGHCAKDVVREEVSAQFERYLAMGLPVRHFDSHHHSHLIMRVLPTVCAVAEKYAFKTVRRGINVGGRDTFRRKLYYGTQDFFQTRQLRRHKLTTTRYMCDFKNFVAHFDAFHANDTVELMVHPFYAKNGKLDDMGELSDSGLRPMREVVDFINGHRGVITLVSYAQLLSGM